MASLLPRASSLFIIIILTRVLPVSEFGSLAVLMATGEMLESAGSTWLRVQLLREEGAEGKLGAAFSRSALLACLASLLACFIGAGLGAFSGLSNPILFAIAI